MSNIKQFFDKDGNDIYPVTHASAVFDEKNISMEDNLNNINSELAHIENKLEGFVNINDFIESDNDDYTIVFKNAIEYCIENHVRLFVPSGIYEVGRLEFTHINNLHIEGVVGQTILKRKNSDINENILQIHNSSENGELIIKGIVFDGANYIDDKHGLVQGNGIKKAIVEKCSFLNTVNFNAISFSDGSKAIIRDCYFKDVSSGPYLLCDYSIVENCIFEGNIKWGVQSTGTTNQVVTGCLFNGIIGGVICGNTSYNAEIRNIIINKCIFKNIQSPGINTGVISINKSLPETLDESINTIVDDCVFENIQCSPFYIGGLYIQDGSDYNCKHVKLLNNIIIINNSEYSNEPVFNIYNVGDLVVSNNDIKINNSVETTYNIIELRGVRNKNIEFYNNNITFEQVQTNTPSFVFIRPEVKCVFEIANLRIDNFKAENVEFERLVTYDISAGSTYGENNSIYFFNNKNDLICHNDYTTSDLYENVYFKYIYSNTNRDCCKKDYAIGLISYIEQGRKMIYYNGENILSLNGTV